MYVRDMHVYGSRACVYRFVSYNPKYLRHPSWTTLNELLHRYLAVIVAAAVDVSSSHIDVVQTVNR